MKLRQESLIHSQAYYPQTLHIAEWIWVFFLRVLYSQLYSLCILFWKLYNIDAWKKKNCINQQIIQKISYMTNNCMFNAWGLSLGRNAIHVRWF